MGKILKISSIGLLNVISVSSSRLCTPIKQKEYHMDYEPLLSMFSLSFIDGILSFIYYK